MFRSVMNRLLKTDTFIKEYPDIFYYPPKAFIKPGSEKEMNAYASAHPLHGAEPNEKTGKVRPVVMITQGFMKRIVNGDENSLAVIMGHEIAHLSKKHVTVRKGNTAVLALSFGRDDELEADLAGLRYAVAAGFPYKKAVTAAIREMKTVPKYSSFEGLNSTHPSWDERLALLDKEQSHLWTAMGAFQNGNVFLELEQYAAASQCFKAVVSEFPDCYEAWTNHGFARLMQYCDGLDADDLKRYNIGQIVTGAFYQRPESLEAKVRGIDEKLWKEAVTSLNRSLSLNPELVLPRVSLGVAHLVHPDGKDLKKARKWFAEALEVATKDPKYRTSSLGHAALLVNSGVADMAAGDWGAAEKKFEAADEVTLRAEPTRLLRSIDQAICFNWAISLGRSKEKDKNAKAHKMLQDYLTRTSTDSLWWSMAYDQYARLCKQFELKPATRLSFIRKTRPQDLRVVTSVTVGKNAINLSDPIKSTVERLGKDAVEAIPLYPESKIARWRCLDAGVDLLAKDKILAIFLSSEKAPPLIARQAGVGGVAVELKIGMSEKQAKYLLKDEYSDRNLRYIADTRTGYQFYPEVGVGLRYADARVAEIVIAQVPRRSFRD